MMNEDDAKVMEEYEEDGKMMEEYEEDGKVMEEFEADLEPGEDSEDEDDAEMAKYTSDSYKRHRFFIMYHGTTMKKALKIKSGGFIQSPDGILGRGVYVSHSFEKARRYPLNARGKTLAVLKLKVRVGKVKRINYKDHPWRKTWHSHGFNTAWVPPNCGLTPSGLGEYCVYDTGRIKVLEIIPNRR